MKVSYWLVLIGLSLFSSSCVSNYVVSTTSFNPSLEAKEHYTSNGIEIPKANLSYKNHLHVEDMNQEIQLVVEEEIEVPVVEYHANAISYTAYSVLEEARTYLGTPYRWGGTTRYGIDCSAFTQNVFQTHNIWLPRVARLQAKEGTYVPKSELQKGDLLFFITRGRSISHVGIVENVEPNGEIKFIHASSSQGVTVSSLNSSYWSSKYQFAKRVI